MAILHSVVMIKDLMYLVWLTATPNSIIITKDSLHLLGLIESNTGKRQERFAGHDAGRSGTFRRCWLSYLGFQRDLIRLVTIFNVQQKQAIK